jgi:hypothetical protein
MATEIVTPSELMNSRRWVNKTKLNQSVHNRMQDEYVKVVPGGCVQGAQFSEVLKHSPYFREVLYHLTPKELYPLIQAEKDKNLLTHLSAVERYDSNRTSVIRMFEVRLKVLRKEELTVADKEALQEPKD